MIGGSSPATIREENSSRIGHAPSPSNDSIQEEDEVAKED